jgi:hypothetical protein
MFEKRLLRIKFVPKTKEAKGGWRKLPYEELRDSYPAPSIVRAIKLRRIKWVGHVACMGQTRNGNKTSRRETIRGI